MNVAYDISLLGLGMQSTKCRTGIHRVVENTFQQLVQADQINLLKVSLLEGQAVSCQEYLDAYLSPPEALHSIFKVPESQITKERVKRELKCLKERAKCSRSHYLGLHLKRMFLKTRHQRALRAKAIWEFLPESLEGVDIFHSPFAPIPNEVKLLRSLTCFETIYDLILIKHPEFFRGNEQEAYRKRLSSFTGDEWLCCISNSTRNDLLEVNPNLDPDRVRVTHLAASSDFYPCDSSEEFELVRHKYGLPEGTYFLCLSTFEPRKNLIAAIRAFVNLVMSGECPDASLVLVGSLGWDYDSILKEIGGAKEARKRIYSTGYVEDFDLATIYSNALAFVYMSYYEGFGLPPLEAMQSCAV
jgi:glycosyltransferase involved in cell wall biosynthesis